MSIPSIAMIPSGYKANKVYSVLPTDGSGDLDNFARTSTATRVNSDGLIEEVAIGVPRLDYTDGGCPSLLLEPASINLITYSEDYSNAYWTKSGASVISGFSAPSVDSPLAAFKLVEDTSNGEHRIYGSERTVPSGVSATESFYIKANGRSAIRLSYYGFNLFEPLFNFVTNTLISSTGGTTPTIKSVHIVDDWYRVSVSDITNQTVIRGVLSLMKADNSFSYIGDGISGVYLFGSQIEQQSSATSYIPTPGTTISRTADSASKSGISSLINSSQGVLYFEGSALVDGGSDRTISLSDGTQNNALQLIYHATSKRVNFRWKVGNSIIVNISDYTYFQTDNLKIALKFSLNDFSLWINGIERAVSSSGAILPLNTLNELNFNDFEGNCKDLRVYNQILSSSELQILTTI